MANKKCVVYFPSIYPLIGVILVISCILIAIFADKSKDGFWVIVISYIVFICGVMLGIYILLYCGLWQITYNEEFFIYRSMFGRVTKIYYSEIVRIKRRQDVSLYTQKKRYFVDKDAIGSHEFLMVIARKALPSLAHKT